MKRTEINQRIREAENFFAGSNFALPPFASWTLDDWQVGDRDCEEIFTCGLGWDVTDFGRGNFLQEGLLLFTIRNGCLNHRRYPKPYAEKIMIVRENQVTLMHCHVHKTEDIINRGGGNLIFELYNREGDKSLAQSMVTLQRDGIRITIPAGGQIVLKPGESITLFPHVFHQFWAQKGCGDVMVGEVSAVNDDHHDNIYHQPQLRFPEIEEDEPPYRLLVSDYRPYFS